MEILYTVEEKYLQAIEELYYGELPKALHLFQEIVSADEGYARAYYQLGCLYHYQFKNYQSAGYYYKRCIELDPSFPDVYVHYLKLVITLERSKLVYPIANKALAVAGVCRVDIYENLGLYAESRLNFLEAIAQYKKAALAASGLSEYSLIQDHLKRVNDKQNSHQHMIYTYQG